MALSLPKRVTGRFRFRDLIRLRCDLYDFATTGCPTLSNLYIMFIFMILEFSLDQ